MVKEEQVATEMDSANGYKVYTIKYILEKCEMGFLEVLMEFVLHRIEGKATKAIHRLQVGA